MTDEPEAHEQEQQEDIEQLSAPAASELPKEETTQASKKEKKKLFSRFKKKEQQKVSQELEQETESTEGAGALSAIETTYEALVEEVMEAAEVGHGPAEAEEAKEEITASDASKSELSESEEPIGAQPEAAEAEETSAAAAESTEEAAEQSPEEPEEALREVVEPVQNETQSASKEAEAAAEEHTEEPIVEEIPVLQEAAVGEPAPEEVQPKPEEAQTKTRQETSVAQAAAEKEQKTARAARAKKPLKSRTEALSPTQAAADFELAQAVSAYMAAGRKKAKQKELIIAKMPNCPLIVPISAENYSDSALVFVSKKAAALCGNKITAFTALADKIPLLPGEENAEAREGVMVKTVVSRAKAYIPVFADFKSAEQAYGKQEKFGIFTLKNLLAHINAAQTIEGLSLNPSTVNLKLFAEDFEKDK